MADFPYLDKRVQRTKLAFYNAMINLLELKKYEHITVKDIIGIAGYSRGSFYNHYNQKDDLLDEMIASLFKEAAEAQRSSYITKDSFDIQKLENEPIFILQHFKQYRTYYKVLLGKNIQIEFRQRLMDLMVSLYLEDFDMEEKADESGVDKNLLNKYYAYGTFGLIIDWAIDDFPTEPEAFSLELVKTIKYSLGNIHVKSKRNT